MPTLQRLFGGTKIIFGVVIKIYFKYHNQTIIISSQMPSK